MNKVHIFFDEKHNLWFGYFENNPIFKIKGKTKDEVKRKLGLLNETTSDDS
tara:strand:- start:565 stop:717 length:153 start_codon:yes stop_codon:yes gene_type:complete